jgi:2-keto-4-pentenoate hydratase
VIGYLTSSTELPPGGEFDASGTRQLRVDAEVALEVGSDGRAARFGAALEFVDVARPPHDFETIVAENVWHRGVAFGPFSSEAPPTTFRARVLVEGAVRDVTEAQVDVAETLAIAMRLLGALGERLELHDRIIAGSILHVPVRVGDDVVVDLGPLGTVGAKVGG